MEWLKKIRELSRLTQNEVASRAGVAQATYSNIENCKRSPSPRTAKKIAAVLGFDWKQFYDDVQEKAV